MKTKKKLKIKGTNVYERNYKADKRIIVNQGGTRSSKTYSLAQLFITLMFESTGKTFTICRKTLPALKATAMKDFFEILKKHDLYDESNHHKTERRYYLNGNEIDFLAVDEAQKVRGRKRDYLWMNESNEFSLEDFRQLNMRTGQQVYMDFNPSDQFHWIYDEVMTRDDCEVIKSTYRDNPFLPKELIKEIERYKHVDENYWRIYGLGERGVNKATIFTHWDYIDELPDKGTELAGLDFGFNHPTALVKVILHDDDVYSRELLYETGMNNDERISKIFELIDEGVLSKDTPIYADAAEPEYIKDMQQAGLYVIACKKGKGSVNAGIDELKKRKWRITKDSLKMIKEAQSYKWKTKNGEILDTPVKKNDHSIDALRYAVYSHIKKGYVGFA